MCFFNIRRTASSPAVKPSPTLACSVRSLMVHLAYPSGGLPQAVAMILASMAPSILRVALSEMIAFLVRQHDLVLSTMSTHDTTPPCW